MLMGTCIALKCFKSHFDTFKRATQLGPRAAFALPAFKRSSCGPLASGTRL